LMVPDDQVWSVKHFTGQAPIAKFTAPKKYYTDDTWGVFCTITAAGMEFHFEKIDKSVWQKIWDWIVDLVAKVIETVKEVIEAAFDFLKTLGCSSARTYIDGIAQVASGQLPLRLSTENVVNPLLSIGIPMSQIEKLESGMPAEAAKTLANAVIDKVCGSPPSTTKIYPARSVQALDPSTKLWIVAAPKGTTVTTTLSGLGTAPDGTQYEIVDRQSTQTTASTTSGTTVAVVSIDELKKYLQPPWYKSPWFWGSVAVLGVGGFVGWRKWRKRRA